MHLSHCILHPAHTGALCNSLWWDLKELSNAMQQMMRASPSEAFCGEAAHTLQEGSSDSSKRSHDGARRFEADQLGQGLRLNAQWIVRLHDTRLPSFSESNGYLPERLKATNTAPHNVSSW